MVASGLQNDICDFFRNTDFVLTGPVAFTLFSIFTALQFTVATLPLALRSLSESKVCFERMKDFLVLPEYQPPVKDSDNTNQNDNLAIVIEEYNGARDVIKETSKEKKTNGAENKTIANQEKKDLIDKVKIVEKFHSLSSKFKYSKPEIIFNQIYIY